MIKPLSVLIVEDSESDAQLIVRMLTKAGYTLTFERVETAAQMRAALEKQAWEIVISDYSLPEFDGHAALMLLLETGLDIPFIAVSGTMGEETAVDMMKAGADDYVMKGNLARLAPAVERELIQAKVRRERKQAVELLKESAEQLHEAQKLAHIGVWDWKPDTDTVTWTEELYRIAGLDPLLPAPTYKEHSNLYTLESWELLKTGVEKAMETGESYQFDLELIRPNGDTRYVNAFGGAKYDSKGQINGLFGTVQDITEHKQAEEALRESEEEFRSLFENSMMGISQATFDGHLIRANTAYAQMYGYATPEEMMADAANIRQRYANPEDRDEVLRILANRGVMEPREMAVLRRDGTRFYVLVSAREIRDSKGNPHCYQAEHVDITTRKRAEEELIESKAIVDAVVENIPLMLFLKEATDLRFVIINRAGEELLGYDRQALLGKNNLDLFPPEQAAHFMAKDREVLDGDAGMLDIPEEPIQTARKGQRLLHTRKICIRGADGTTKYLLGISEDITERKQAEQKLHEYSEHLEEMVTERTRELRETQEQLVLKEKLAVLGQIAGGVAHELRNPLGVILNAIYYLKLVQPEANEKVCEYHGIIEQEAHIAEKIITDLLDFARVTSADREPVSILELVQRILEHHPAPPSVQVALKLAADLPKVYVDSLQMEQVLGNLVVNAYQAMSNGGTLIITTHRRKEMVTIAVKDTGVGIPPENMPKLFEPLFSTKITGIGLGLAVSKKLIEANDGRIEVESEPGKGSAFTVTLPIHNK